MKYRIKRAGPGGLFMIQIGTRVKGRVRWNTIQYAFSHRQAEEIRERYQSLITQKGDETK